MIKFMGENVYYNGSSAETWWLQVVSQTNHMWLDRKQKTAYLILQLPVFHKITNIARLAESQRCSWKQVFHHSLSENREADVYKALTWPEVQFTCFYWEKE